MPRIRSIKPEFWTSADVMECSTNARLLFIGLWNFCDDAGRHSDSAKQVKAEVFPGDDFDSDTIRGMLDELAQNGLIVRYTAESKDYFYLPGWHHQRIDKPQKARFPDPFQAHSENDPVTFASDTIRYDTIDNSACANAFARFWKAYPKKLDRKRCEAIFKKLSLKDQELAAADAEVRPATDPAWLENFGKYVPHPKTYLNNRKWDDEWKPCQQAKLEVVL